MSETSNLPTQISEALVAIPKGLTPGVIKALDRLATATVGIPVAWLNQKRAKIDAQTESYKAVEASIALSAVTDVGVDAEIRQRAIDVLVRKEYRKQVNREAVAAAMVKDIREHPDTLAGNRANTVTDGELEDDWMNVFERYAEDASSERLQDLWGRVLAGEIRQPGRFSTRSLRFLSEFSQADALLFEKIAQCSFGDFAPKTLVQPDENKNISDLIHLEASGLIQGASTTGLRKSFSFDSSGVAHMREENILIYLEGKPMKKVAFDVIALTVLGQEMLCLVGGRDRYMAAKSVAHAIRSSDIQAARLCVIRDPSIVGSYDVLEELWGK